ncbi:MAG: molybdopterin-guanine dinucleotide biosynthesis protein B, partial [Rhodomicrobium sp.]
TRGLNISAVKHAHHAFDIDHEGRDSYRYRAAGAQTVAISSRARFAIMTELRGRPEPTLGELTAAIKGADLILVEGFKSEKHPKLEVRRLDAMNRTPLASGDPSVVAIAADFGAEGGHLPVFGLDDVEVIADFILNLHQLRLKNKERS